jgi:CheY-like chemotaxis protein/two-component sensor histidine kinase
LENSNFQLKTIIDNMLNLVKLKAEENSIQLTMKIEQNVPRNLIGDQLRLSQILINLASNAVKFSHSGDTVSVHISLQKEDEQQAVLHFSVKDSGIGLPLEQLGKLFQSFSQADSSTTRQYGGTGLGLAISKKLTELMGGKIWAESKENAGSTFHFTACLKKQINTPIDKESSVGSNKEAVSQAIAKLQGAKILVVDDNELNQELAKELLIMNGALVETAYDGQEALDFLSIQAFDCVLMDCQMPVMDGHEAARQIRLQEKFKHLPVIAMTANAMKGDKEKVLVAGMNDHIAKPIDPDVMFATIAKWI